MMKKLLDRIAPHRQRSVLWRLVAEAGWPYRWRFAFAMALMALVALTTALSAWIIEDVINEIFVGKNADMVEWIAVAVVAIFVVKGAAAYGQQVLLLRVGNRIVADLQHRLYDHILRQGMGFYQSMTSGDMTARMTQNASAARQALTLLVTRLGRDALTVVALLVVMLWQDITLAAIAFLAMPPAVGAVAWLVKRVKKYARGEIAALSGIVSTMNATQLGARVIKAFGLEGRMRARMGNEIETMRSRSDSISHLLALTNPLMETLGGLAVGAVILYGGWRVIDGGSDPGTFFSFITALIMAADPARRVSQLMTQLRQFLAGAEMMYETLDAETRIEETPGAVPLSLSGGEIRLEDVHFAYGDTPALKGISLTARAGTVTALVGPSGSGKSTVLSMIERFHDPDTGTVSIDGQDLRGVTVASLRGSMALVTQETFLFDAPIAENIAVGKPNATEAEIEAAAKAANAHDFIMELPGGYGADAGEHGARLSGGQRQRIAIARAMLRNAPILLLDEATSALDAETETRVQEALDRLMAGRTTIVIAHRLSTVRRADHICVVESGRVVEEGDHDALVARGGLYARLAALQFGPAPEQVETE